MTLREFRCLSLDEQQLILKTQAVFVGSMEDEEFTYNLFQVDSFYLEVHGNGEETVSSLIYFDELNLLEPYLKLISLEPIYQLLGYGRIR